MGQKVTLLLAIHNHQPVGNFPHVLEEAYQRSYLPFLQILGENPHIRLTLHYSGFLLEWLKGNHPEFIREIRELVEANRVEIMSGGFYEPILTTLYDSDTQGQIRKLSSFIKKTFGTTPRGIWLAERVWEPHLAGALNKAGAEYIVMDDHHFRMAGLKEEELHGYYLTEEQGRILKVFPGSERLRYLIPFHPVEETLAFLDSLKQRDADPLAIMGDDGEKFGVWPGTFESVYEKGWLSDFFTALRENLDWIDIQLFSEILDSHPPLGRIYLPTSSYMEMAEWSLLPGALEDFRVLKEELRKAHLEEKAKPFLSGGFWRNFFSKYPESNRMHKKMLAVSEKIHHLPEGNSKEQALDELWQGQCNDAYWHGIFGGLYLPHLRSSIYEHLIRAEDLADRVLHPEAGSWIEASCSDTDKNGENEIVLRSDRYTVTVDPARGGTIIGLDFKPSAFNLQDTLTRAPEAYHQEILNASTLSEDENGVKTIHERCVAKEKGLADQIIYDPYPRDSWIDHFLDPNETIEAFRTGRYRELGDFVRGRFSYTLSDRPVDAVLEMERKGFVQTTGEAGEKQEIRICKGIHGRAGDGTLNLHYRITNPGGAPFRTRFGVEFNLTLLAGHAPDRYYLINGRPPSEPWLSSIGETRGVSSASLKDEWKGIQVTLLLNRPGLLWRFPIETVSQSEGGFERVYQGSSLLFLWDLRLDRGAGLDLEIKIMLSVLPEEEKSRPRLNSSNS